ncbi:hypothetical protein U879_03355 [Defluviimonas sp. 20V17]|nr:SDR family NAD(P)-dependent oxidoreductase [Allgaiera indica]KDB05089.1 hypothetical protein U879_03355 [Defluviimonas sp. 20V17]
MAGQLMVELLDQDRLRRRLGPEPRGEGAQFLGENSIRQDAQPRDRRPELQWLDFGARAFHLRTDPAFAGIEPRWQIDLRAGDFEMSAQELIGKHVVVTGGTGALGRAVVKRLLDAGLVCHVPSRRSVAAGADRLHTAFGVELADEVSVATFYAEVPDLWASVHLAGGFAMAPLEAIGRAEILSMMQLNTLTTFLCCRAAVEAMRKGGRGGRLVNVAARPALEPRKGAQMASYAASKAAVVALTQALAEELKADRILVNAIAPSTMDTPANRAAMPKSDPTKWLSVEAAAEAVLQLISPANMEISGAVLPLFARA